jgi:serine/threonine protein phosphatase 1
LGRPGGFACDVAFLRGAQEEMWQKLLQLQFASNPREVLEWMLAQGVDATLRAYGGDPEQARKACREGALGLTRWTGTLRTALNTTLGHAQLMTALRRAAFTQPAEGGGLLFVHAGITPDRPLDAQKDAFWWGSGKFLEMTEPYSGYRRVVRGFDRRHEGLVEGPFAVSLDAGCGFGGPLLAACLAADGRIADKIEV